MPLFRCRRRGPGEGSRPHPTAVRCPSLPTTSFLRWNHYNTALPFIGAEGGSLWDSRSVTNSIP
jgi:hypothetical protein